MLNNPRELGQNELFGTLTVDELSTIAAFCSDFVAIEDSLIFQEGRNASHLYVITDGQVALQKAIRVAHATRSRRTTITVCSRGDIVGWSALANPHRYTLSAVAWDSCRLISVEAKMLRRALDMYPETGYKVMASLSAVISRRLRQVTDTLISERQMSFAGLGPCAPELGGASGASIRPSGT